VTNTRFLKRGKNLGLVNSRSEAYRRLKYRGRFGVFEPGLPPGFTNPGVNPVNFVNVHRQPFILPRV